MVGRKLQQYEIVEPLGQGGMGVVYKARDTRLDRFAAVKVLLPERVADSKRKQRFTQEAKAASALSHPNIVHIYDIGETGGVDFIAMEFVSGKTLDRLIPRHGMPPRDALRYAVQIADALARAHAAAIVHRDIKPGNIMVTEQGLVKVLDFGLAKLTETVAEQTDDETRTQEQPVTEEGTILGTVTYMSPEQAEGKRVDARSDIFSFGALLYEMLTGRRAFQGDTRASTLAAILREEPKPASQVVEGVPPELDRIVRRCLRKDPAQRVQHMDDLKVALEELKADSDSGMLETRQPARPNTRHLALAAVVVLVLALGTVVAWVVRSHAPKPDVPPMPVPLTSYPGDEVFPSFSPDGTQVAFQWCPDQPRKCDIYVKQIGVEPPYRLTDTPGEKFSPAWSPDGRTIAFARRISPNSTNIALVLVPQRGGRERVVAEIDSGDAGGLAWTPDSKWLISPALQPTTHRPGLQLFSVDTGQVHRLTTPPADASGDSSPAISPDGYTLAFARESSVSTRSDIYLLSLATGYTPIGEPRKVYSQATRNIDPAWMPDGHEIVYACGAVFTSQLCRTPVARSDTQHVLEFAREAFGPAVSPQGNRLAYVVASGDPNIWRVDLHGLGRKPTAPSRFIASTRSDSQPAYSPDGNRIAFVSDRSGTVEIWVCDRDGSNPAQLTSLGATLVRVPRWSPNGASIAFEANPGGNQVVYVTNLKGGATRRLTYGPGPEQWPDWSRDGQYLYLISRRGGRSDIWRIPATGGEAVQITRNASADIPQASLDGSFLYYSTGWPNPSTVWRIPAGGGEPTKILDGIPPGPLWTVAEEGIYFFDRPDEKGHSHLCLYEFSTLNTRRILTIERPPYAGIAPSPDHKTILFTQFDQAGTDLMLVENFR